MIRYIGLNYFTKEEVVNIKDVANSYNKKLKENIDDFNLVLHMKKDDIQGKKARYSVSLRIEHPSFLLTTTAMEWDLRKTVHEVFERMVNRLHHKFRTDVTRIRKYEK